MTIFLGCGFAAKYREGGGNFSVPLQWMLGLRRLKLDAIWLEVLPATDDARADRAKIENFQGQLRAHGLAGRYCLLYQNPTADTLDLDSLRCVGISKRELLDRLGGPNVLLNLAYSIHPPLLLKFERRIFCDLDPSEIFYWMTKMEVGQSYHHEFWTIGLNVHGHDCQLPKPLVAGRASCAGDTSASTGTSTGKHFTHSWIRNCFGHRSRPRSPKFRTVGQWYWGGAVEVAGEFPDLSKRFAFEPYLNLPARVPEARFELAMNIAAGGSRKGTTAPARLAHRRSAPRRAHASELYRRYLAGALAEFTAIKGVDVAWRTGWLSDRAAAFLALGRPVITEDTGAYRYLPAENGFCFIRSVAEAEAAVREVLHDWSRLSKQARQCAVEVFDSVKNLRRILDF